MKSWNLQTVFEKIKRNATIFEKPNDQNNDVKQNTQYMKNEKWPAELIDKLINLIMTQRERSRRINIIKNKLKNKAHKKRIIWP